MARRPPGRFRACPVVEAALGLNAEGRSPWLFCPYHLPEVRPRLKATKPKGLGDDEIGLGWEAPALFPRVRSLVIGVGQLGCGVHAAERVDHICG